MTTDVALKNGQPLAHSRPAWFARLTSLPLDQMRRTLAEADQGQLTEIRAQRDLLAASIQPASWNDVAAKLMELAVHKPRQDLDDDSKATLFFLAYQRELAEIPMDIIELVVNRMILDRERRFFPGIGDILHEAGPRLVERQKALKAIDQVL